MKKNPKPSLDKIGDSYFDDFDIDKSKLYPNPFRSDPSKYFFSSKDISVEDKELSKLMVNYLNIKQLGYLMKTGRMFFVDERDLRHTLYPYKNDQKFQENLKYVEYLTSKYDDKEGNEEEFASGSLWFRKSLYRLPTLQGYDQRYGTFGQEIFSIDDQACENHNNKSLSTVKIPTQLDITDLAKKGNHSSVLSEESKKEEIVDKDSNKTDDRKILYDYAKWISSNCFSDDISMDINIDGVNLSGDHD
ncbi:MAG: hypothetical protein SFT91_03100 [Rickettsiaceae bacterium]|nr:hypothetical protein [Rickettsiaceae bacterium]